MFGQVQVDLQLNQNGYTFHYLDENTPDKVQNPNSHTTASSGSDNNNSTDSNSKSTHDELKDGKTVQSAVIIMPPKEMWGPIDEIRKIHDKGFIRWMPHINMQVDRFLSLHSL